MSAGIVDDLEKLVPLAPLHQPHNLAPIRLLLESRLDLLQVACAVTGDAGGPLISAPDSAISVWTSPTNEELMIARHTADICRSVG